MVEAGSSEINIEHLMAEIREAVARREAEGQKSLIGASLDLHDFLAAANQPLDEAIELPPLELQPEFSPNENDHYHVDDLLQYHDHTFIWNAYRAILGREPDEVGFKPFLQKLRSGSYDKIDILASLRFSPEGQSKNVTVDGLKPRPLHRRLYGVPLIGYLVEMIVTIALLPAHIHRRRQFEEHALAQQELMASHINQSSRATFQTTKVFHDELANLSKEQRKFAELHHQQVIGLFREHRILSQRLDTLREETEAWLKIPGNSASPLATNGRNGDGPGTMPRTDLDEMFAGFADKFRGDREEVKRTLMRYLPILKDRAVSDRILDVGCGRGEWLELMRNEGYQARGVEKNSVLVERVRELELEVMEEDALTHLASLPAQSLNVVTAFHFIEHLEFATLIDFFDEVARVLKPGGLMIVETPNPKNLVVAACNFYSDPTHNKPLFPEAIQFILESRGFADVRIDYVNPIGGSPFSSDAPGANELNSWFYSPRDFALIGTRL